MTHGCTKWLTTVLGIVDDFDVIGDWGLAEVTVGQLLIYRASPGLLLVLHFAKHILLAASALGIARRKGEHAIRAGRWQLRCIFGGQFAFPYVFPLCLLSSDGLLFSRVLYRCLVLCVLYSVSRGYRFPRLWCRFLPGFLSMWVAFGMPWEFLFAGLWGQRFAQHRGVIVARGGRRNTFNVTPSED